MVRAALIALAAVAACTPRQAGRAPAKVPGSYALVIRGPWQALLGDAADPTARALYWTHDTLRRRLGRVTVVDEGPDAREPVDAVIALTPLAASPKQVTIRYDVRTASGRERSGVLAYDVDANALAGVDALLTAAAPSANAPSTRFARIERSPS